MLTLKQTATFLSKNAILKLSIDVSYCNLAKFTRNGQEIFVFTDLDQPDLVLCTGYQNNGIEGI